MAKRAQQAQPELDPQSSHSNLWVLACTLVISRDRDKEGPWDSLVSQSSLNSKFQDNERPPS